MKWVNELNVADRRVFVRVDYNVPVNADGEPTDDVRLVASLPTLHYLRENKARLILGSHLGRPDGIPKPSLSLIHVASRVAELLGCDVVFPADSVGDAAKKLAHDLKAGDVMLLENLRFHKEEEANDPVFAERLAGLAEVYVNDAFGTLHRAHASTAGMVKKFSEKGAGFLVKTEIEALSRLLAPKEHPFVAILGGAKVSDKIALLESLIGRVDTFLLGGALALTLLAAQGHKLGCSKLEEGKLHIAKRFLERAQAHQARVILPVDHQIGIPGERREVPLIATNEKFPTAAAAFDIGPKTQALFAEVIGQARLIFWNGPMGLFEQKPFDAGTVAVARAAAESKGFVVVGGGDSAASVNGIGLADRFAHVSTGGGAALEYIEGTVLPGLAALA